MDMFSQRKSCDTSDSNGEPSPPRSNHGDRKAPPLHQHSQPGGSPELSSASMEHLKRYIDIALHSMEHRLLAAMSGGGDAPAMQHHGARPAFGAKLGAANAAGPVTSLALASVKEEEQALLEQAIGETERDRLLQ